MRVVVEVTAEDVRQIHQGLLAELQVPGPHESAPIRLRVRGISPFVDPATGTASCELELANAKSAQLPPPGVITKVSFRANVRKGISLPDSVVTYRGKDPFVRIVDGGHAKLIGVVLGRKQGSEVEILKGLKPGDVVVERTSKFVGDGEEVEIQAKSKDDGQVKPAAGA